ncbi:MAG: phospholipase [Flavobacteriaceae bacterium]|nr:phospholipase [Flavobacteriaceae bacterium]|tara:strand:+ start:10899 stop:11570 length:672 start_codon:yes stop_codon:yes gene_type:complete
MGLDVPLKYKIKLAEVKRDTNPGIFLLHGYGSNEDDLFSFAQHLPNYYTIVSFRAPISLPWGGFAWYNITYDNVGINSDKFLNLKEAKESLKLIKESIDNLISYYKLNPIDTTLMGFSQGSVLTWAMAINFPKIIRRTIALSGYISQDVFEKPIDEVKNLTGFCSHGKNDQIIPIESARKSFELISKNNPNIFYKEYDEGHGINQENFQDLLSWLDTTSLEGK